MVISLSAKSLSHLHTLLNEQGKPLYHGFLLPRSIFLIFDSSHQLQNISIRDHGFSYAIGHDRIFKHYDDIQKGKKVLEPYYQHSLNSTMGHVASGTKGSFKIF